MPIKKEMTLGNILIFEFVYIRFYKESFDYCSRQIEQHILKKYKKKCNIRIKHMNGNPSTDWLVTDNKYVENLLTKKGIRVCKLSKI